MRFRKLQQLIAENEWEDHGYAYELADGRCTFRFNPLVWESTGARLSARLTESGTPLEAVEQIIPSGPRLRWLAIETLDGDPAAIKATLDTACQIPQPRPVSQTLLTT